MRRANSMLQFLWLTRLRDRWLGNIGGRFRKRPQPAAQRSRPRRLRLEALEDRLLPNGGPLTPQVNPSAPGLISPSPSPSPAPLIAPSAPSAPPVSGTWTKVTPFPTGSVGTMLLLPNGNV